MLRKLISVLLLPAWMVLASRESTVVHSPTDSAILGPTWRIQSSAKVQAQGADLSTPGFQPEGWHSAKVPSTVLGALVQDGVYTDPFFGKNLGKISADPFKVSWWYRTEFLGSGLGKGQHTRLVFEGINYRANIWLNGKQIASKDDVFGVWRVFDLDVSHNLREGANALAVEVFPPKDLDFSMGYADWNPAPQDANMGLFRAVKLRRSGEVSIEDAFVQSHVDLKTLKTAELSIAADLVNHGDHAVFGTFAGEIGTIHFHIPYALQPGERKPLRLTSAEVPSLHIRNPRIWWPVNLGEPNLYTLKLRASVGKENISDRRSITFGIREVGDYLNEQGHRGYTVNGRKILIRGGGWTDDIFLREDPRNLESQIQYVRQMNLNTIRMEGFWGTSQTIYDLADRYGILIMPGFSCQWEWDHYHGHPGDTEEYGAAKLPADIDLQAAYLRDQVRLLRNHPSIFVWVVGSDKLPWPEAEARYKEDLKRIDPSRPYLSSCKSFTSVVSGPSAVKMLGPYNYITPNFWFIDRANGGAYGFNTETGPGPQSPPLASLKKMIPLDKLWPQNEFWNYHCALGGEYGNLDIYMNAFKHRYGDPGSVEEFAFKAQAANYEAIRAMYEAFGANKPESTGIIQWMLNSAWPKIYWQLYDYYLMPGGGFFGARKGSQPLNLLYDCGHHSVHLVNDTQTKMEGATARLTLLDFDSKVVFEQRVKVSCPALASSWLMNLPALSEKSPVYFLDLKLEDAQGRERSRNFYWLSTKKDDLDPEHYTQNAMPNTAFADFKALNRLPAASVKVESIFKGDSARECSVTLTNTSDRIAFFLELQVQDAASKEPVLPVLWDDNYISLLPGERRTLRARMTGIYPEGAKSVVAVKGWNSIVTP